MGETGNVDIQAKNNNETGKKFKQSKNADDVISLVEDTGQKTRHTGTQCRPSGKATQYAPKLNISAHTHATMSLEIIYKIRNNRYHDC